MRRPPVMRRERLKSRFCGVPHRPIWESSTRRSGFCTRPPLRLVPATTPHVCRQAHWRGRYVEADQLLESTSASARSQALATREACIASRVAIGRREIGAAVSVVTRTLSSTDRAPDPALRAQAAYASAFVHLAVGDLVAADREVARCVAASRAARDPVRALKARLIGAESARRQGRGAMAAALLARVDRLASGSRLPVTVSARCALLRDLLAGSSTARVKGARPDAPKRSLIATWRSPDSERSRSSRLLNPRVEMSWRQPWK